MRHTIDLPFRYIEHLEAQAALELRFLAVHLGIPPHWLTAVIAHETAGTFAPDICSGGKRWGELPEDDRIKRAVGLIQWTHTGCAELTRLEGKPIDKARLAAMSQSEQMRMVSRWYEKWRGKIVTLGDCYAVVFWPAAVGKGDSYVLPLDAREYALNKGLDLNKNGVVTLGELERRVAAWL